jgi:hypothetical protein
MHSRFLPESFFKWWLESPPAPPPEPSLSTGVDVSDSPQNRSSDTAFNAFMFVLQGLSAASGEIPFPGTSAAFDVLLRTVTNIRVRYFVSRALLAVTVPDFGLGFKTMQGNVATLVQLTDRMRPIKPFIEEISKHESVISPASVNLLEDIER